MRNESVKLKRGGVRKKSSNTKQKRPRRADFEYPYLEPSVSLLKRSQETEDLASYTDQLNSEEKAWLNQFAKEYINADTKNGVFHKTAAEKKICNDKNNARNRCWYTEEAAANRLNLVGSDSELEQMIYGEESIEEERNEEIIELEDEEY